MRITVRQQRMMNAIAKQHGLSLVMVFGSYATGHLTPLSDIDIAVLPKRNKVLSLHTLAGIATDLADVFGTERIDVVSLDTAGPLLRYEAMTKGKTVIDHDRSHHADLHIRALRDYEDTKHFRATHSDAMQRHLKAGTFGKIYDR